MIAPVLNIDEHVSIKCAAVVHLPRGTASTVLKEAAGTHSSSTFAPSLILDWI